MMKGILAPWLLLTIISLSAGIPSVGIQASPMENEASGLQHGFKGALIDDEAEFSLQGTEATDFLEADDADLPGLPGVYQQTEMLDALREFALSSYVGVDWVVFDIRPGGDSPRIGIDSLALAVDSESIPEPTMMMLMGLALIGIVVFHRRGRSTRKPQD